MKKEKRQRRPSRVLDEITLDMLQFKPKSLRDKVIVGYFIFTPLRRVEVAFARIENIQNGRLFIPYQKKTKTPVQLKLPVQFISVVDSYIHEHLNDKTEGWMFPSKNKYRKKDNLPITVKTLYNWFIKIIKECGLVDIGMHDLRATFFTSAGAEGIPEDMLEQISGTSKATISAYYRNYTQKQCDSRMENMRGFD